MGSKTALVVIDTQLGMFETPGVPPVPNGGAMAGGFAGVQISFGERAGA